MASGVCGCSLEYLPLDTISSAFEGCVGHLGELSRQPTVCGSCGFKRSLLLRSLRNLGALLSDNESDATALQLRDRIVAMCNFISACLATAQDNVVASEIAAVVGGVVKWASPAVEDEGSALAVSSAYHDAGEDYGGGDGMGVYDEVDTAEVREVDRSSRNDIWRMVSWKGKYDLADMKHLWERKPPSAGNTPEADEE